MTDDLSQYYQAMEILMEDIRNNKISYEEALARSGEIWKLIPIQYEINPVAFYELMKEKYKNHPEWGKHERRYIIEIGNIPDNEIESYVKGVAEKFKKDYFLPE